MTIEEYKAKVEWYLAEEYMISDLCDVIMSNNQHELMNERVDNLIEVAYKKNKSIMAAARRLKIIVETFATRSRKGD